MSLTRFLYEIPKSWQKSGYGSERFLKRQPGGGGGGGGEGEVEVEVGKGRQ